MKRAVVLTSLCLLINGSVSAFNGEHLLQACVIAQAPLTPDAVRQSGYQHGYCMGIAWVQWTPFWAVSARCLQMHGELRVSV